MGGEDLGESGRTRGWRGRLAHGGVLSACVLERCEGSHGPKWAESFLKAEMVFSHLLFFHDPGRMQAQCCKTSVEGRSS